MSGGRFLRTVALGLAVSVLTSSPVVLGAGEALTGRVPVILVHGLTGGDQAVWGERGPKGHGLYAKLLRAGYTPGQTLFSYDYDGAPGSDYATLAKVGLAPLIGQALAAAGSSSVDLVSFGSGALLARYWVATSPGGRAPVRNLVMVAPPNHGLPQADVLKVLYHTDRLVRVGRPTGTAGGTGAAADAGTGAAFLDPPVFVGEDQYVGERSRGYQTLYGRYVLEARLIGPEEAGASGPPPGYEEWLTTESPGLVEKRIYGAQRQPSPAGLGLTLAYYEMLSVRVGRQLYLAKAVAAGRLPPLPSLEELLTPRWREELQAYLRELLVTWGLDKAKGLWARLRAGLGVSLGEILTSLAPGDAAMSRLVPEHLAFPGPRGAPCETGSEARPVLCNGFLHDWQERESQARPEGSRYVTIAGDCPSPLGLLGLDYGPNDLVVEAASALSAPLPADDYRLGRGLAWAHALLGRNSRVQEGVLAALAAKPVGASGDPGAGRVAESGSGLAGLWGPVYCVLARGGANGAQAAAGGAGPGSLPSSLAVEVSVGDPAASGLDGLTAIAWLASDDAAGPGLPAPAGRFALRRGSDDGDEPVLTGALETAAPAFGKRLLLGVRLVPDGGGGGSGAGDTAYLTMGRYLKRDVRTPFAYSVGPGGEGTGSPPSGGGQGSGGGDLPGEGLPSGTPGEGPAEGSGSQAGSGTEGESGPGQAEIVPTPNPPLIQVILVTKLTTDKRENRTFHVRWEWDFGDGERLTDEDPSHTTVSVTHTYRTPGTYAVTTVSVANDGRLLRRLTWTVEVKESDLTGGAGAEAGGQTFSFEAETIVEPAVVLTLTGPQQWVTGKPARFVVKAEISWPPRTRRQVLKAYPGWEFDVVWAKPGTFEVRAAVTVRQSYEFPDGQRLTVYNTYVTVTKVEVFTPGLTG